MRSYTVGDEVDWVKIQSAADAYNVFDLLAFEREFGRDPKVLADRQLFALNDAGNAVGTVTSWLPEGGVDDAYGRLHWLAVIPSLQKKGLGSALIAASLNQMKGLGYSHAYLTTSSIRETALRLYVRFGFRRVSAEKFYYRRG